MFDLCIIPVSRTNSSATGFGSAASTSESSDSSTTKAKAAEALAKFKSATGVAAEKLKTAMEKAKSKGGGDNDVEISAPSNFQHAAHMGLDGNSRRDDMYDQVSLQARDPPSAQQLEVHQFAEEYRP